MSPFDLFLLRAAWAAWRWSVLRDVLENENLWLYGFRPSFMHSFVETWDMVDYSDDEYELVD
jgi:hypothetical protein